MAPPVAILDPRRDKLDRKLPRMSGESREVSRLREAHQIAPGREDHRQLAAIGHRQRRLGARPEALAVLGLFDRQSMAVRRGGNGLESSVERPGLLEIGTPARKTYQESVVLVKRVAGRVYIDG